MVSEHNPRMICKESFVQRALAFNTGEGRLGLLLWCAFLFTLVQGPAVALSSGDILKELSEAETAVRIEREKAYAANPDLAVIEQYVARVRNSPPSLRQECDETFEKLKSYMAELPLEGQERLRTQMNEFSRKGMFFWLGDSQEFEAKKVLIRNWLEGDPSRAKGFKSLSESTSTDPKQLALDVLRYHQKHPPDLDNYRFGVPNLSRDDYDRLMRLEVKRFVGEFAEPVVQDLKPASLVEAENRLAAIQARSGKIVENLYYLRLDTQETLEHIGEESIGRLTESPTAAQLKQKAAPGAPNQNPMPTPPPFVKEQDLVLETKTQEEWGTPGTFPWTVLLAALTFVVFAAVGIVWIKRSRKLSESIIQTRGETRNDR